MILAEPEIWTRHQRAVIDGAIGWTSVRVLGLAGTAHGHFVQRTAFIHHRVLFRTDNCFCTGCCGYKFRYVSVGKREDLHGKWTEIRFARGRILNGIAEIFISNRNPYRFGRAKSVLHVVFLEIIYSMRCLTWHLFYFLICPAEMLCDFFYSGIIRVSFGRSSDVVELMDVNEGYPKIIRGISTKFASFGQGTGRNLT